MGRGWSSSSALPPWPLEKLEPCRARKRPRNPKERSLSPSEVSLETPGRGGSIQVQEEVLEAPAVAGCTLAAAWSPGWGESSAGL